MPTTLPTRLPHPAARAAQHQRPLIAELASIAVALLYLLLLAWSMASLETNVDLVFGHDPHQGAYNPMEPSHQVAARRMAAGDAR
jgi:hypothetical protein